VVILPDAPRIINIGTHVSLFATAITFRLAPAAPLCSAPGRAVMIQFTVDRRLI
jgi:hypothetical protein